MHITLNSTLGMLQIPWFTSNADSLNAAPEFDAAGLILQLHVGETIYTYSSESPATIEAYIAGTKETPADNTEVVWRVLDAASHVSVVYIHSSIYSTLDVADGEGIGWVTTQADGYGGVAVPLTFSKGIKTDENGRVAVSEFADNTLTPAAILDGALNDKGNWNIGKTGYALTPAERTAIKAALEVLGGKLDTTYRRRSRIREDTGVWYMDVIDGNDAVVLTLPLNEATDVIPAFDRAGDAPTA